MAALCSSVVIHLLLLPSSVSPFVLEFLTCAFLVSSSVMVSSSWTQRIASVLFLVTPLAITSTAINHTHAALGIHHYNKEPTEPTLSVDLHDDTWYSKYPAYPPYCSTPNEMEKRKIPPLKTDYRVGDSRLVHVTSVIRHGARTPYSANLDCWDGYWDTAVWNCNLTTFLAPPLTATGDADVMFLFEKLYDALLPPLSNELNGTCQLGQLLLRGFSQEIQNGKHLRDAYTFDGTNMDHDVRMRLLDLSSTDPRPFELLKYRSDDDQRTLMSGQVLLRGLFGDEFVEHAKQNGNHPIISLHTADRDVDILSPAENLCERLVDLRSEAEHSHEYKAFLKSKETKEIRKFIDTQLGKGTMQRDALDCIMTTICTDRPLPEAIDDYGRNKTDWLKRISENNVAKWGFHATYNDGAYSKLAMGPLWTEILENIQPIINANDRTPPPNRLALFSGHDTTLLPLLISLGSNVWDGEWPPYASMMVIEIHEFIDGKTDRSVFKSDFAFRLLMNGEALTWKMEGCPPDADLCDIQVLLGRVTPFATADRDCKSHKYKHPAIQESNVLLSTFGGIILVLCVTVTSGLLGSFFTYYYLTRQIPCQRRYSYDVGMAEVPSNNGISSYHDEVDGFRDEPGSDENSLQLKTITGLVE